MKNKDKSKYLNLTDETSVPRIAITEAVNDILKIAEEGLGKKRSDMVVLDIGSGFGMYTQELARHVKRVIGVEPFKDAYMRAIKLNSRKNVRYIHSLIENYKGREKFDLAISLTTLEHMPNAEKSYNHVLKLMKKNAMLYLTAPNKLWPIESHYALPFLSWFPLPLANFYLQILGKGNSYKDSSYSRTYFGMKKLLDKFPYKYSFVLPSPDAIYLGCGTRGLPNKIMRSFGIWLINRVPFFWILSKGFIVVVRKSL